MIDIQHRHYKLYFKKEKGKDSYWIHISEELKTNNIREKVSKDT
jgi:hypothetical protein